MCKGPVEGWAYSRFIDVKEGGVAGAYRMRIVGCEAQRSQEAKTWQALWVMLRIMGFAMGARKATKDFKQEI